MEKKRLPTWVLIWISLLLTVLVVVFADRSFIDRVGDSTGWYKSLSSAEQTTRIVRADSGEAPPIVLPEAPPARALPEAPPIDPNLEPLLPEVGPEDSVAEPEAQEPQGPLSSSGPMRKSTLYFINVGNEGKIELFPSVREMAEAGGPLSASLAELLRGPTPEEMTRGYLSLIPPDTRLLSARVQDETAFLSFSDEFQYNTLGMEGYVAQLRQIIFTATEFPQVKRVQFLIKGQYKDALGAEGVAIGKPLDRGSF